MMSVYSFGIIALVLFNAGLVVSDYCYLSGYYYYCSGCCTGSYNNEYCDYSVSDCDTFYIGSLTIGAFIGIIIGCLLFLGIFITVIVVIVASCTKKKGMMGRVVHPTGPTTTTFMSSNVNGHHSHAVYTSTPTSYEPGLSHHQPPPPPPQYAPPPQGYQTKDNQYVPPPSYH